MAEAGTLDAVAIRGERDCPAGAGQAALLSAYPFAETVERLKAAIATEDLWVIAEIDPQMLLKRGGFAIPSTRQILYFHPRYMARLLASNAAAIVEAPLKFVIMDAPSGEVVLRYPEPKAAFARYDRMSSLSEELGTIAARIAASVANAGEPPIC